MKLTQDTINKLKNSIDNVPLVIIEDGFIKIIDPNKQER